MTDPQTPTPSQDSGSGETLARECLATLFDDRGQHPFAKSVRAGRGMCIQPETAIEAMLAFAALSPQGGSGELLREALSLIGRVEAAGLIEHEGSNVERWKQTARELAPRIRAFLFPATPVTGGEHIAGAGA